MLHYRSLFQFAICILCNFIYFKTLCFSKRCVDMHPI